MLRSILMVCCLCGLTSAAAVTTQPEFKTSLISSAGKYVPLPEAAHQPKAGSRIVFDVTGAGAADEVLKGLDRVAMFLNLAAENGPVHKEQFDLAVVLHGNATAAALNDENYGKATEVKRNPNLPLMRALRKHGVRFYVCGQALARKGYVIEGVSPEVTLAVSALTVIVNEQNDGAAYVPFH